MPRNGSGTYSLPAGQPVVTGTVISSTTFNTLTSDLATALTQSLATDGQTTPTANLPMGNFKLTNLGNGSASTDSINYGQVQGLIAADRKSRNRIINGGMSIDQRNNGSGQTITNGAALAYTVDRWYGYCTGANVTGQRVAGSGTTLHRYQFTGAGAATGIGFGQRIERADCIDMAGSTATLGVDLANSLLASVSWAAYYANSADSFGTLASPTRTLIASGTFTVTPTVTRYTAQISIPAAATTGLEVVFTVGAQTSGTWTIGNVQLEQGTAASAFERRSFEQEIAMCQRFYQNTRYQSGLGEFVVTGQALTTSRIIISGVAFPVPMFASPTVTVYSGSSGGSGNGAAGSVVAYNAVGTAIGTTFAVANTSRQGFGNRLDGSASLTIGDWYSFTYVADAEL